MSELEMRRIRNEYSVIINSNYTYNYNNYENNYHYIYDNYNTYNYDYNYDDYNYYNSNLIVLMIILIRFIIIIS